MLFHALVKGLRSCEGMSTIIIVSPLISITRDQVEPLKRLGFSAAIAGIGEESDEGEEKVINGECEIESWLPKSRMKELKEGKLGQQTAAVALEEVCSVTEVMVCDL